MGIQVSSLGQPAGTKRTTLPPRQRLGLCLSRSRLRRFACRPAQPCRILSQASLHPIVDDPNSADLPVLEEWRVRGNNRYSGYVSWNGKREPEWREMTKCARLFKNGEVIELPKTYGQKLYRLGEPYVKPVAN